MIRKVGKDSAGQQLCSSLEISQDKVEREAWSFQVGGLARKR